jgi:DNA gyrase subunit A
MERFGLTKIQAEAIVDMRLRRLTGLERDKLTAEFEELAAEIKRLTLILENEHELYAVIRTEITRIRDRYGDERRTAIVPFEGEIDIEDLINDETMVITMTNFDYIKRLPLDTYKTQTRGGRGIIGVTMRDEDVLKDLFIANTHDDILFFTTLGKVYTLKAYAIPEAGRQAKGTAAVNLLQLTAGERVAAVMPVRDFEGFLMFATKEGIVKKTPLSCFANVRKNGLTALLIRDGDELISVMRTGGNDQIFLATRDGMGIRFNEKDVRTMGRTSAGVIGIRFSEDGRSEVIAAAVLKEDEKVLVVSEKGYGKRTDNDLFRLQSRGGKGSKVYKVTEKTGPLVGAAVVSDKEELMLINSEGNVIRIRVDAIRETGRAASGVKLIRNDEDVTVVSIAKIAEGNVEQLHENGVKEPDAGI